jgi:quercetin dioxygenase-like cupin family protein
MRADRRHLQGRLAHCSPGSGRFAGVSSFADVGAIPPQQIWDGVLGRTVHGERVSFSLVELAPDSVVPEHSHENEQVGILIQGSVTFSVGGETRELEPGGTWRILAHVPHSVTTGPAGAVVVEVFSPVRHDWHAIEQLEPRSPRWP